MIREDIENAIRSAFLVPQDYDKESYRYLASRMNIVRTDGFVKALPVVLLGLLNARYVDFDDEIALDDFVMYLDISFDGMEVDQLSGEERAVLADIKREKEESWLQLNQEQRLAVWNWLKYIKESGKCGRENYLLAAIEKWESGK